MVAILRSIRRHRTPINPAIVISNRPDAEGLKLAEGLGVETLVIESRGFRGRRAEYDRSVMAILADRGVTPENGLVCLAGFMRIVGPEFTERYRNRIMNIHPGLLPAFPGLHAQRQALEHGAKRAGCTVHFVDEGVDTGPIILQEAVRVRDADTVESLSERILKKEHIAYPRAVRLFASERIRIAGRKAVIEPEGLVQTCRRPAVQAGMEKRRC